MADIDQTNLTALTVDLLSAYFANNTLDSAELSGLIRSTHEALKGIDAPAPETPVEPEFTAAVSVRKSLASSDHIISLIDGKPYKTLKRHLSTHGLTPAEYRERYKLPRDYPMVAPSYSQARRDVAARLGLGRKPQGAPPAPAPVETPIETQAAVATPPAAETKAAPKIKPMPKAKTASKAKSVAKAPTKQAAAAQKPTTAKKVTPSKASLSPASSETASAPVAPDETAAVTSAPKKSGRKPKAAAAAPAEIATATPVPKRAPRKSKTATEPAAS